MNGPPATRLFAEGPSPAVAVKWDTTAGSVVHAVLRALDPHGRVGALALVALWFGAVAITFVPLLVAAALGPLPLADAEPPHRLPFLRDWNVLFMTLVSFPALVVLCATDQRVLAAALAGVQAEGVISLSKPDAGRLASRWRGHFRLANGAGLLVGIVCGVAIAGWNYHTYVRQDVGFWIADQDKLLPVGYIYLYCVVLFYALVAIYVVRNIAISLLLRDIVMHAELRMIPLHPDKAGGLRPVGRLGLRNQYALSITGLNLVLLLFVSTYLEVTAALNGLIVAAVVAYLVLGPLVFLAPLLPFRNGMLQNKGLLMSEVAARLRRELQRLHAQLPSGEITEEDEAFIERLRKIAAVIDELPVWPFDATTLRRFLTAYVVPIAGSIAYPLLSAAIALLRDAPAS